MIGQRLLIVLASCAALALTGAPAADAAHTAHGSTARTQIRVVSALHLDLRGSGLPLAEAKLGVALPATDASVAGLLAPLRSQAYRDAQRALLDGFGAFTGDRPVLTFAMPTVRVPVPEPGVAIRHGRAHTWISVWAPITGDGRYRVGPWFLRAAGGRIDVWSTPRAALPRNVTLIQRVRVDGATDLGATPTPERARDHTARWLGPTVVHVVARESAGTRLQLAAAGAGGDRRQRALDVGLLALTALWPFFALGGLLGGRWRWRRALRAEAERLTARLWGLALVAALLLGLLALDAWKVDRDFVTYQVCSAIGLGVVGLTLLIAAFGRLPKAQAPYYELLATAVVVALLAVSLVAFVLPFYRPEWGTPMPARMAVVVTALAVFGLLGLSGYAAIRWVLAPAHVPRAVPVLVSVVAAVLVAREIDAGLTLGHVVQRQHRLGLDTWRVPPLGYLVTDLYDYGATLIRYAAGTGVPLVLLVVLMRLLALRARQAPGLLPDAEARRVIVVLFAVFVGGLSGLWGYTLPVSMWVAGIALGALLTARRRAAEALVAVLPLAELARREKWLRSGAPWGVHPSDPVAPEPAPAGSGLAARIGAGFGRGAQQLAFGFQRGPWQPAPPTTTPSALLSAGPDADWWANGRTAVRLGLIPAVLPAAHYLWAVYAQTDPFAAGDAYSLLDFAESALREYAFWLVGAFAFGALFVWLPGRPGVVKGLTPAAVFAVSQLVVELLPGTFDVVNWPVLAAETALYFAALGAIMDWWTLRAAGLPLRAVERIHGIDRTRLVIQYLSPVVLAAAFVLQQAATGAAQQTVSNIVEIASGQQPPQPPAEQQRDGG